MLVIRMQRTGRSGHAQFRVVVQDSRRTPTSGKIVAALGSYNPHSKQTTLDKEKAQFYMGHGAQPSDRVARLLKAEGVKLPAWVKVETERKREVRNTDKRRSTRPAVAEAVEDTPPEPVEAEPATEAPAESPVEESATEVADETPAEETPIAETTTEEAVEAPAEEAPSEPEAAGEEAAPAEEPAAETETVTEEAAEAPAEAPETAE